MALNDDENAFADFNHAIALDDSRAESWANQALVYERRGERDKALKSYNHAARLDPKYKPAVDGLARMRGAGAS
ncbi:Tfp pilus assembly protein PilF [Agrobacterium larrymoorei]|uniref:Tfp pilus assembly protein PilF n=1 Tax=Agrobacterium larrymoorei TaxID=160699 RepID=A0ABU0UQ06_9HYPH|nr:Tfp pilus assembly protein PilF [Agrobacterium larrymoorei]